MCLKVTLIVNRHSLIKTSHISGIAHRVPRIATCGGHAGWRSAPAANSKTFGLDSE